MYPQNISLISSIVTVERKEILPEISPQISKHHDEDRIANLPPLLLSQVQTDFVKEKKLDKTIYTSKSLKVERKASVWECSSEYHSSNIIHSSPEFTNPPYSIFTPKANKPVELVSHEQDRPQSQ